MNSYTRFKEALTQQTHNHNVETTLSQRLDFESTLNLHSMLNLTLSMVGKKTRAVIGQRSSPAGYILYCNIFIIKPYNIGRTDLDVFVCKSFCHIDIIIQV